jgi:hypothetical protein
VLKFKKKKALEEAQQAALAVHLTHTAVASWDSRRLARAAAARAADGPIEATLIAKLPPPSSSWPPLRDPPLLPASAQTGAAGALKVLRPLHLAKAPRPPLGRRTVSLQPLARAQPPRPLPEPAVVALQPTETNAAATYSAANDDTIDDAYDDAYDDDEFIVVVTAAPLKGLAELQRARVRNLLATHTPSCKPFLRTTIAALFERRRSPTNARWVPLFQPQAELEKILSQVQQKATAPGQFGRASVPGKLRALGAAPLEASHQRPSSPCVDCLAESGLHLSGF